MKLFQFGCVVFLVLIAAKRSKKAKTTTKTDPRECEVCIEVVKEIQNLIFKRGSKPSEENVESIMKNYCIQHKYGTNKGKICSEMMEIKRDFSKSLKIKGKLTENIGKN